MSEQIKEFFRGMGSVFLVIPGKRNYPSFSRRSGFREDRRRLSQDFRRVASDLNKTVNRSLSVYHVK